MSDGAERLLVVDDEPGMREGCRRILASEGYGVDTAEDAPTALEIIRQRQDFAGALVDLKMPGMDGLELIRRIRQRDQDIVLFVITAYATIETAVEATKLGAYDYVPKPFTPDELLIPVRNGLERRSLRLEARRLHEERERRMLELAFERSKSHTIINCMADGVLVVNRDGQLVLRNAAAARILPHCGVATLPAPLDDTLACPELASFMCKALDDQPGPSIASVELSLGTSTFMVNASPVLDSDGQVSGAVAVLRDATALKELDEAKSMFVSMVAHEVKRPLAAIEGYMSVLLSGAAGQDPDRGRRMLERSLLRARGLRTMLSELMDVVAMQTGRFTLKRTPVRIGELAVEARESCREAAEQKNIRLSVECEAGAADARALADREAMRSVFTNLIDNAVKYTGEGGRVEVCVAKAGDYVAVSVTDNGIGMTPEELSKAFDEFFRVTNARTADVPGTGLGLTIVKRLVDMHEGTVDVESAPGKGSAFTVRLPAIV